MTIVSSHYCHWWWQATQKPCHLCHQVCTSSRGMSWEAANLVYHTSVLLWYNYTVKNETSSQIQSSTQRNHMSTLQTEAAKAMTAQGQEYVLKMEQEAKAQCKLHVKKVKIEMEALSNHNDSMKSQWVHIVLKHVAGMLMFPQMHWRAWWINWTTSTNHPQHNRLEREYVPWRTRPPCRWRYSYLQFPPWERQYWLWLSWHTPKPSRTHYQTIYHLFEGFFWWVGSSSV